MNKFNSQKFVIFNLKSVRKESIYIKVELVSIQMFSLSFLIADIGTLVMLPYTALLVFVVVYLAYRKYTVCMALRNVPAFTIFDIDLSKVKQNLKIEAMLYNFLLILSGLELLGDLLAGITTISSDLHAFINNSINQSVQSPLDQVGIQITVVTNSLCMVVLTLLPPVVCLFLIVLRRAYLNLPYNRWIRGYTVIILARFVILSALSFVHQISDIAQMLYFPICLIDLIVYIPSCRSFYRLLEGRSFEARWHSTHSEYIAKRRIAIQFFYAQILTVVYFLLVLIDLLTVSILSPLVIVLYRPKYFNEISLGMFPTIILCSSSRSVIVSVFNTITLIQTIVLTLLVFLLSFAYLFVFIGVVIKLVRRQKKYNHINDWVTRPLMEEYRDTFISSNRNYVQRPPFIQAFRTHPLY